MDSSSRRSQIPASMVGSQNLEHGCRMIPASNLTVDSKKFEYGCRIIYAGFPSFFALGSEDGHVPTFGIYCKEKSSISERLNEYRHDTNFKNRNKDNVRNKENEEKDHDNVNESMGISIRMKLEQE